MQTVHHDVKTSSISTGIEIFQKEGIKGLYRGGVPMILGGAM